MIVTIFWGHSLNQKTKDTKLLFYLKNDLIERYEYLYFTNTVMQ